LGGKIRLSKHITPIIKSYIKDDKTIFIDLFCGGCNIIDKIDNTKNRIANDSHSFLIEMWKELQSGWQPNKLQFTKEYYTYVKNNQNNLPKYLVGLVGFHYSYGGKWWGGFARSRYDNHIEGSIEKTIKQMSNLIDVEFTCKDYRDYSDIKNAVLYCDPPYANTTQKSTRYDSDDFNHEDFWNWCKEMSKNNVVLVSECDIPQYVEHEILWEKVHNSNLSHKAITKSSEKLVKVNR